MDRPTLVCNHYTIRKLHKCKLYQLEEFVVYQNYRHHKKEKEVERDYKHEILSVYREELSYSARSHILVATTVDDQIIGSIRLMKWDRKQRLPIQTYFHLPSFTHLLPNDKAAIWHIGRFAINSDANCGLILFKQLMLYAMIPIYENRNDVLLAECDNKLLRAMKLMGVQAQKLGEGISYLGSETTPIYIRHDGLSDFFQRNRGLLHRIPKYLKSYCHQDPFLEGEGVHKSVIL